MSHLRRTIAAMSAPVWAQHLTEDDEWTVRTALANVAHDLESVADRADSTAMSAALSESAKRYRDALARIERTDV